MPKSKKRRGAKPKQTRRTMSAADREELARRLTMPLPDPRPKHPGYDQACPVDELIAEFGEDGAQWLVEEYERPLTVAEFMLEQGIRRDAFVLDDPFTGPETVTAQKISEMLDMTFQVSVHWAKDAGWSGPLLKEAEELAALGPIDHAAEGADVVREAFAAGAIFLNDRARWDFGDGEAQSV